MSLEEEHDKGFRGGVPSISITPGGMVGSYSSSSVLKTRPMRERRPEDAAIVVEGQMSQNGGGQRSGGGAAVGARRRNVGKVAQWVTGMSKGQPSNCGMNNQNTLYRRLTPRILVMLFSRVAALSPKRSLSSCAGRVPETRPERMASAASV